MGLNNNFTVDSQGRLTAFILHWPESQTFDDDQFFEFCQVNNELRIEKTALGDCEIMAPTGGETGWLNSGLTAQLYNWATQEGNGIVFDSSGGFILPSGAIRSPDAAWVKKSRLANLTHEQKKKFLPLCPDFVIELKSPSDNLKTLQAKMQEYIDNGANLGWLIDPDAKQVFVYQPQKAVLCVDNPELLTADALLKGFKLDMQRLWDVGF
jgi:Uma2 family endonuclease